MLCAAQRSAKQPTIAPLALRTLFLVAVALPALTFLVGPLLFTPQAPASLNPAIASSAQSMQRTLARLSALLPTYLTGYTTTTAAPTSTRMASSTATKLDGAEVINTPEDWKKELELLPSLEENGGKVPSVFLAHGQPFLLYPRAAAGGMAGALGEVQGPGGLLSQFLKDLGPCLIKKYKPKAIVVFSAHWETPGGGVVTDYGDENPLLYDFYGFPDELYQTKFKSSGDHDLAERVVSLLQAAKIKQSRLTSKLEPRGEDGRGFSAPGFDHGVFVPFKLMFNGSSPVPIIQVSISSTLTPAAQRALGAALEPLRSEGVLIISGGLTLHNLRDFTSFNPKAAKPVHRQWEEAILDAVQVAEPAKRAAALDALVHHPAFHSAHPRAEHFVPIYVAAGAAQEAETKEGKTTRLVCGLWGAKTLVFGV
ncbi:hypothetical protein JCM5296_006287 [Sporobolomyces johnsonii]